MESVLKGLVWPVARGALPCPDLIRRLRVRRAAKALVTCRSWPEDDATTGIHAAQLAMLRILWLQRETRRLTRGRHREAAVLMSRSALETSILGVYCLFAEDPVSGLKADNLRTGFEAIVELLGGMVPRDILKEAITKLGTPNRSIGVRDMATHIDGKLRADGTSKLYNLVYAQASNYFVHANAGTLGRHIRPDNKLSGRPTNPWLRRSPVRLADGCVGLLAVHLARFESAPAELFFEYGQTHLSRVLPPLLSLAGKRMGKSAGWAPLVQMTIRARKLRSVLAGPLTDTEREALVRDLFRDLSSLLGDVPDEAFAPVIEFFVRKIVQEYAHTASS